LTWKKILWDKLHKCLEFIYLFVYLFVFNFCHTCKMCCFLILKSFHTVHWRDSSSLLGTVENVLKPNFWWLSYSFQTHTLVFYLAFYIYAELTAISVCENFTPKKIRSRLFTYTTRLLWHLVA
jgi:hypothetical protein